MVKKGLDPKVLGQLLLMQSFLNNLPDKKSVFSFVCNGLLDIPGIAKAEFHEPAVFVKEEPPYKVSYPISVKNINFGTLLLISSDPEQYNPYEDYLKNFFFMIGIILEERRQRRLNEEHQGFLEQKILERTQEVTREKEKLVESQRRFTDLMKNVMLLSVMLDINGNIIFCNKYLLKLTNYTFEDILGQNWFDMFIETDKREEVRKAFADGIKGEDYALHQENVILTRNGEKLLISWNNTLLRNADKSIIGTASIGENITERRRAEEALKMKNHEYKFLNEEYVALNDALVESLESLQRINFELEKAKAKAEESDHLKTSFLQNMSHEIRTPMNAIMGFSALLAEEFSDNPRVEKFTNIILQRSNDLLEIINDILDIAKIESGQVALNYTECNLLLLFTELSDFFEGYQQRMNKQHISFSLKPQCNEHCIIVTDVVKLKQILTNLINNAFKFTNTGTIEAGCLCDNEMLSFYIKDTGLGIPLEKQQEIFERFTQLSQPGISHESGTGLGLSIVKGLVSLLGGEIKVNSAPGKGSTFSFSIPYKP
jgi:PAS domain S-box-containing protein